MNFFNCLHPNPSCLLIADYTSQFCYIYYSLMHLFTSLHSPGVLTVINNCRLLAWVKNGEQLLAKTLLKRIEKYLQQENASDDAILNNFVSLVIALNHSELCGTHYTP